ncbi:septum formation family protein [Mumia sp. DW29H23]|uniref:septum formation family protein n=1 Tax=Mumia sp. DW29H23 TaxID=3421241 RepID=UPI003D691A63
MTAARRLRIRDLAIATFGAGALVLVSACASATDLAKDADPTTPTASSEPPVRTLPPTEGTPTPSAAPTTPTVTLPKAGECRKPGAVDAALRVSDDDTAPVACAGATSVTYLVRTMPATVQAAVTAYDTTRILSSARAICEKGAIAYLGSDASTYKRSQFGFVVGVPSAAQTAAGARWMRCDLVLPATAARLATIPAKSKGALKGAASARYMQCVRGDIRLATGTVPCTTKHQWRGVASVKLGAAKAKYAGAKKVQATMRDRCPAPVRRYLDTTGSFDYGYISPSRTAWQRGERYGVCFAKTRK